MRVNNEFMSSKNSNLGDRLSKKGVLFVLELRTTKEENL